MVPYLLSIVQLIGKGRRYIFGENRLTQKITTVLAIPLYPVFCIMQESILIEASKSFKISIVLIEEAKLHAAHLILCDIGLESHLQLIISITLLLLANTETNTITGLEVLFETENLFYMNTKLALALSISWSLISCIRSQIKGISKKRVYATVKSTVCLLIFTSTSIALRIFSTIFYLTPAFGLFQSLRHLQGEMYPYWAPYNYPTHVNMSTDLFHFGNAPPIPWHKITRWNYTGKQKAEPPNLTLYTYFTIEQHFIILICIFGLHFTLQLVLKIWTNPTVAKKLNLIDKIIHGVSCCFIPHPMQEWDEEKGTVSMHRTRKDLVFREMLASILLNFSFNLLLLSPLIVLSK